METKPDFDNPYQELLSEIKQEFEEGRIQVVRALNAELINRYFAVGEKIVQRQKKFGWGKSVVEQLSKDLQTEFPRRSGFSARNLWDMRRFYSQYAPHKNLRQLVAGMYS
ncbi:MAG TPA: DUF1016 N-terminal domain-containing protein [Anseongella sp.]